MIIPDCMSDTKVKFITSKKIRTNKYIQINTKKLDQNFEKIEFPDGLEAILQSLPRPLKWESDLLVFDSFASVLSSSPLSC